MPASDHDLLSDMQAVLRTHGGRWSIWYSENGYRVEWRREIRRVVGHTRDTIEEAAAACIQEMETWTQAKQ